MADANPSEQSPPTHKPSSLVPKRPRSESPVPEAGGSSNGNSGEASTSTLSRARRRGEEVGTIFSAPQSQPLLVTSAPISEESFIGAKRRRIDEDDHNERFTSSATATTGSPSSEAWETILEEEGSTSAPGKAAGPVIPSSEAPLAAGVKRRRDDSTDSNPPAGLAVVLNGLSASGIVEEVGSVEERQKGEGGQPSRKRVKIAGVDATAVDTLQQASTTQAPQPIVQEPFLQVSPPPEQLQLPQAPQLQDETEPCQSPILTIPFEIFAEILLNTVSLFTVLSLSRTCKSFRSMLLQPSSDFIWQGVRISSGEARGNDLILRRPPAAPDFTTYRYQKEIDGNSEEPGELLFPTEAAYAAFVYGGYLECEICGKPTGRSYISYSLRVRLCQDKDCRTAFRAGNLVTVNDDLQRKHPKIHEYIKIYPTGEGCLRDSESLWELRSHHRVRLNDPDVEAFIANHRDDPDFLEKLAIRARRVEKWNELCYDLVAWRNELNTFFFRNKKLNETQSKAIALAAGWDYEDLMNCTDYGPYHRHKCHIMESISGTDIAVLLPRITEQLFNLGQKRQRRIRDAIYHTFRDEIIHHYKYLVNNHVYRVLPSLSAFRDLPVMLMLQKTDLAPEGGKNATKSTKNVNEVVGGKKGIRQSLRANPVITSMLKDQITQWVEKAARELGEKLLVGVALEGWSGPRNMHPVEWISARFKCKRCTVFATAYAEDECFDFKGACAHECGGDISGGKLSNKKKNKLKWDAENFERDDKAIAVIIKCSKLLNPRGDLGPDGDVIMFGAAPGDKDATASKPANTQIGIVCTSCNPTIPMSTRSMIGHSHRHDDMQIDLFDSIPATRFIQFSFVTPGYTKELLGATTKAAREIIPKKIFGCRYCYTTVLTKASAALGEAEGETSTTASTVPPAIPDPPGLTFNGLRSHLKAKHKIEKIRDEDYFLKTATT